MRPLIASALIGFTLLGVNTLPRPRYESKDVLSHLTVPFEMAHWKSRDISGQLNIKDRRYSFVDRIFARQYANDLGENLLFLIVDARNFHHPKVCFGQSGYDIQEQPDMLVELSDRKVLVRSLFMKKNSGNQLVAYWMVIDKKPVDWTGQKLRDLAASFMGKKNVGLMGRLDIPVRQNDVEAATRLAKEFMRDIGREIPETQKDDLFGSAKS